MVRVGSFLKQRVLGKMLPLTCGGLGAAPGPAGAEPEGESGGDAHGGAGPRQHRRQGFGIQEWSDGSRYEGDFVNGFKHGSGRYTWKNGEYYEGSFYKDYRHGCGLYCWPTGHRFIGKFYLNRKEGYGEQIFANGTVFQGLYHADQRFGPGVVSYPDGCQDVGLWLGERLLTICTAIEGGFSLQHFPEYAAFAIDTLTQQPSVLSGALQTHTTIHSQVHTHKMPLDESFILPPGIESYSTDGDHLPLPPGRRRELDEHFYGKLWEPDAYLYKGYEKDPLSTLPLQARMQTHIHKHRLQAENLDWGVTTVLSLSREGFGPKGPLEVTSELLIQHASKGKLQAVSEILKTGLVHPDIGDSQGYTALIAATVNCHNDVIQLMLDMGADIDKLNSEGMSPLAVCHVLYYPFHSLNTTLAEQSPQSPVLSACNESPLISQAGSTTGTHGPSRPQTAYTALSDETIESQLSDQSHVELKKPSAHLQSCKVCIDDDLITEHWADLSEPKSPTDTVYLHEEEREKNSNERESEAEYQERGQSSHKEYEEDDKGEEEKLVDNHYQTWQKRKNQVEGLERKVDSRNEYVEPNERVEKDADEKLKSEKKIIQDKYVEGIKEKGNEEEPEVEHSCLVLDGHIALGSVHWKGRGKVVGRIQGKNELIQNQNFDSACSVSSYKIQVTEELMQRSAEALSRTGIPQRSDTQETVRRMAAMKIEHRVRLNTLKLLLERGADPNVSTVPMPVLFLAVMAGDTEVVRRLLLRGARTDIALTSEKRGLYPLHVAASLPGPVGPSITEMLLHAISDPDIQASDQDEIYKPDNTFLKSKEPLGNNERPHHKERGRTALHIACQRDSDYLNASKVVALLLAHRASTDMLWSGHSPLSLAIASGNDLAVEELLKGGADPNIPLGSRVGSALCVLANINYHLGGNRTKLLDMLAKAGADILMPVTVEDVVGTAVDFAHYSFNKDLHIAKTPFHALNMREREIFKTRCQLLSMMGDLLRKTAAQKEREYLEGKEHNKRNAISSEDSLIDCDSLPHHSAMRKPLFMFCYQCGLSVGVKLTACSRCHKVFYCSRACKLKGWDKRHKDECIRVSAPLNGIQKGTVFTSQKGPTPMTVTFKTKPVPKPTSVKVKFQNVLWPLNIPEKVSDSQLNLKENYSHN